MKLAIGSLRSSCGAVWSGLKKFLFWHPFGRPVAAPGKTGRTPMWRRMLWGCVYRLAVVPILVVATWVIVLITLMHPGRHTLAMYPEQFSLTPEDVQFTSADGVDLSGWFISTRDWAKFTEDNNWKRLRPAVVLCHDYGAARDQLLWPLAKPITEAGYDVLLFDFRGHGKSDDAPVSFGVTEAADVMAAVEYLRHRPGVDPNRIAVIGTGMGAYAAMVAAPHSGVQCVVAESAYPSINLLMRHNASAARVPAAIGTTLGWGLGLYFGERLMDDSAMDSVASLGKCGLLLISGADDRYAPPEDLKLLTSAAPRNVSTVVVAHAGHGQTFNKSSTVLLAVQYLKNYLDQPDTDAHQTAAAR